MVEYDLAKVGVEGSNPFSRSINIPEKGFEESEVRDCDDHSEWPTASAEALAQAWPEAQ